MGGGGGQANNSTVTKTDSENRTLTVNKVFDNAGNVYLNSTPATYATGTAATAPGLDVAQLALVGAAVGLGLILLSRR